MQQTNTANLFDPNKVDRGGTLITKQGFFRPTTAPQPPTLAPTVSLTGKTKTGPQGYTSPWAVHPTLRCTPNPQLYPSLTPTLTPPTTPNPLPNPNRLKFQHFKQNVATEKVVFITQTR